MEIRLVQPTGQPHLAQPCSLSQSAIHALTMTDAFTPEQAFELLLAQACRFGQLPTHLPCIHGMLRAAGYMKHAAAYDTLDNAARLLTELGADRAIVRLDAHYAPLLRAEDGSCYALKPAVTPLFMSYSELWLPLPAGKAAPAPRPPKPSDPHPVPEHRFFRFFQPNPLQRQTGDCVLRGMAAVLQMSWADAMHAIAQASGYRSTQLNSPSVFEQLLEQKGFIHHEKELTGKARMTGCEFCQWAAQHYTHGEPILAYIGQSHVAAVLPEQQPDGTFRYAIHDCWDSTSRKVTGYWVRPFRAVKAVTHVRFTVGQDIVHPSFGIGRIVHIHGEGDSLRLTVAFAQGDTRLLSGAWVHAHCSVSNSLPCPA